MAQGCRRPTAQSVTVLDQIAEIKHSDALLCEAFNQRISDRFLARMGWERHMESSSKRHFIKRFYGKYPAHGKSADSQPARRELHESVI